MPGSAAYCDVNDLARDSIRRALIFGDSAPSDDHVGPPAPPDKRLQGTIWGNPDWSGPSPKGEKTLGWA